MNALQTVEFLAQHLQKALLLTKASRPVPCFSSLSNNDIGDIGCYHLSKTLRAAISLEELG